MATRQATKARMSVGAKIGILAGAILVALAAAYCVLCGVAGQGDTLRPGTAINGVSVGDMTQDAALDALQEQMSTSFTVNGTDYSSIELVPQVDGVEPFTVDLTQVLEYDMQGAVEQAMAYDHGGFFLTRGLHLLSTLGGGKSYTILPCATDASGITTALEASGVLDMNTTVQTTYELTEDALVFTMGTGGVSVDEQVLVQQIIDNTAAGNFADIQCPLVDSAPDAVDLQAVHDAIFAQPSNATLSVAEDNSYTVVASVQGVDFDQAGAEQLLAAAGQGETVSVPLVRENPAIDTATLEAGLFRDVLGEYTTDVSGSSARRSNVKLAGEKCSGTILLPGETFSYNGVVGQRTAAAGFQEAGAYLNGETVQELGGGVCQGSSTLYCAVLYANLEIVERHNHTYVSSYVPLGMDATVSWNGPDFQFKNNTDYPIKVVSSYANSKVTFQILGTKVSDFKVEITTKTLETMSPGVQEIPDGTMAAGTTSVEQSAHTGYKVQSYRHVYDGNGNLISESDEAYSAYRKTDKIIRVGTLQPEPPAVEEPVVDAGTGDAAPAA